MPPEKNFIFLPTKTQCIDIDRIPLERTFPLDRNDDGESTRNIYRLIVSEMWSDNEWKFFRSHESYLSSSWRWRPQAVLLAKIATSVPIEDTKRKKCRESESLIKISFSRSGNWSRFLVRHLSTDWRKLKHLNAKARQAFALDRGHKFWSARAWNANSYVHESSDTSRCLVEAAVNQLWSLQRHQNIFPGAPIKSNPTII